MSLSSFQFLDPDEATTGSSQEIHVRESRMIMLCSCLELMGSTYRLFNLSQLLECFKLINWGAAITYRAHLFSWKDRTLVPSLHRPSLTHSLSPDQYSVSLVPTVSMIVINLCRAWLVPAWEGWWKKGEERKKDDVIHYIALLAPMYRDK